MKTHQRTTRGFGLAELMVALALVSVLVTGVLQIVGAASSSFRLQKNLATLQENARFALTTLGGEILPAGYQPKPWNLSDRLPAITGASVEAVAETNDQLGLRRWSQQNCLGNLNPVHDASGQPAFHLRETEFAINTSGGLAITCRYGPGAGQMTTQLNRLGLITDVEAFQVLYAEDSDQDGDADRWVAAGAWQAEPDILAVRLAMLLRSPETVGAAPSAALNVLGQLIQPPADGRLHRVFTATYGLEGRRR